MIYSGEQKGGSLDLVKFDPAVAYHFCLTLPEKFSQPGAHFLPCPVLRALAAQDCCYCRRREPTAEEEAMEGPLRRTDNAILLKSQVEEENEEIERVQNKR